MTYSLVLVDGRSQMSIAKEEARRLLDRIPDDATWDDIMYEFYVRQKIEDGLKDVEAGRVVPHEEVKARLRRVARDMD
jgi:predicted transcriptional regulator